MVPAIGFSMDLHWCGNKVKLVSVDSAHKKKCPCNKKMPPGCCKDVHVSVKLIENQKAPSHLTIPNKSFVKQVSAVGSLSVSTSSSQQVEVFDFANYHAPPFKSKLPVYLAISVFRI